MRNFRKLIGIFLLVGALLVAGILSAAALTDVQQAIVDSCASGETINVEQYNIHADDFYADFWAMYYAGKLPWYVDRTYTYTYDEATNNVKTFTPMYLDKNEYDYLKYEQRVAEIIDATVHEGMSDWQIALSVHDYLVAHSAYDETYTYFRGYDLIARETAVCNGYAEAYMDIMTRLGFDCTLTVADDMGDMGHAWNILRLGDHWYHVDATWDDPVSDTEGTVMHTFFLKTDEEMLADGEDGHHSWQTDLTCNDTGFSEGFWNGVSSQIIYESADTCYLRVNEDWTGYIQVRDSQSGEHTLLHTVEKEYVDIGYGEYAYETNGLSLWNGRLYFSDANTVYSMLTDGTDLQVVHEHNLSSGTYIHGSHVANGLLYLTLSTHNYEDSEEVYRLTDEPVHEHKYASNTVTASCEEGGYVQYTCQCGITFRGEDVAPTGHNYDAGVVVKEATRKEAGIRRFTCLNCGATREEEIPATGGGLLNWFDTNKNTDTDSGNQGNDVVENDGGQDVIVDSGVAEPNEENLGLLAHISVLSLVLGILAILVLGVVIVLALLLHRRKKSFYDLLVEGKVPGQNKK